MSYRARLYTNRYVTPSCKPPAWLVRRIERRYPRVRLDWHPGIKRWCLWECVAGTHLNFLVALATDDGGYVRPTIQNTIGWLREHDIKGMMQTRWDIERWLDRLDEAPPEVRAAEQRMKDLGREFGNAMYDHLVGRVSVSRAAAGVLARGQR